MTRILVVEDDRVHRKIIREILAPHGYDVMEAADGIEAIHMQRDHGFDLILTDVVMPGMEGIETVRDLPRLYPDLRIIAISAYKEGYLAAAEKLGAMATIEKPFDPHALAACVESCLRRGH